MIFEAYGLPPVTGIKHYKGECPLCKAKGSFRADDKEGSGSWICKCDSGNGWKLLELVTGKEFKTLAREIDQKFGNFYESEEAPKQKEDSAAKTRSHFLTLEPLAKSQAVEYLHSRGIYKIPNRGIRYSAGEWDADVQRKVPCMYAVATNEYNEPAYIHLTYIENGTKARVPTTKKMHTVKACDGSVAVKFAAAGAVLGIAEGIETALSAELIYKVNTWAVLSAAFMKRFTAPDHVETLYIFSDNDWSATGHAAAFECARKNLTKKNPVKRVYIRWPRIVNDFNDLLMQGDEVCELIFDVKERVLDNAITKMMGE